MRIRRLLAVANLEIRSRSKGSEGLRFVGLALVLLLPAGLLPSPFEGKIRLLYEDFRPGDLLPAPPSPVPGQTRIGVQGNIPSSLRNFLVEDRKAPVAVTGNSPVIVLANEIPAGLRGVLATLEGPGSPDVRRFRSPIENPGRSLLLAILAMSLLAGPIAESLPGERARRTLEVLLSAGITRFELLGGKWLTWTMAATTTAWFSSALGCWRGLQEPGWWILGLPLFLGCAVALSLWLVRLADDVVGGTAAPMRVLPIVTSVTAIVAGVLSPGYPILAAAVPIGGPLLLAAALLTTPVQAAVASASAAVTVGLFLAATAKDLGQADGAKGPHRFGALGLGLVATLLWWLILAGPGIWEAGGDLVVAGPGERAVFAGGLALAGCAVAAWARDPERIQSVRVLASTPAWRMAAAVLVGVLLAAGGPLRSLFASPPSYLMPMLDRLHDGALPYAMLGSSPAIFVAALVSIAGQALLFRNVLPFRLGWMGSALVWAVAVCPLAPWSALVASLALGILAARFGAVAALVAHLTWAVCLAVGPDGGVLATMGGGVAPIGGVVTSVGGDFMPMSMDATGSILLQAAALAVALAATRWAHGSPMRHHL